MDNNKIVTLDNLTTYNNKIQDKFTAIDNVVAIFDIKGDGNSFLANDGTYKIVLVPTKISELTNDANYVSTSYLESDEFKNYIISLIPENNSLDFPIYLYTEEIDSDYRRRESDDLALDIISWYDSNRVYKNPDLPTNGHYIPTEILAGKIFLDDNEVIDMRWEPSLVRDCLTITVDGNYESINDPLILMQYTEATATIQKGAIDVMEN